MNSIGYSNYCNFFFFNDTPTTEIYTLHIVGSVRCVQETGYFQTGSLSIQKRACACGTNTIHGKVVHYSVSQNNYLGVLTSNLQNGLNVWYLFLCRNSMSCNFIFNYIGSYDYTCQLPAAPGCTYPVNTYTIAKPFLYSSHSVANSVYRLAACSQVKFLANIVIFVNDDKIRAY
eukprot:TRINITY_DN23950_c0_g1_i1.p2 TRINITY_DN23950_c0_g1~~TRINITY_DN23950_c0_g1_i1.p2  ORF type:complete len:174 (+),score=2.79 TRINITY_DN23950_c0_g1_i1:76-597(+)